MGTVASARNGTSRSNGPLIKIKEMFRRLSLHSAEAVGSVWAFGISVGILIFWGATGPRFHFSDTWQLVINTGTSVVTFLMVFLIQNTQNRDTMALQLKLSELILAVNEAENRFASAEDLSEEELEKLHEELRRQSEAMLGHLNTRRAAREKRAS